MVAGGHAAVGAASVSHPRPWHGIDRRSRVVFHNLRPSSPLLEPEMKALKWFGSPLVLLACAAIAATLAGGSCAGTKPQATGGNGNTTGLGGFGGMVGPPPIDGLTSLTISPPSATVVLSAGAGGVLTSSPQQFMATGIVNGVSMDVTSRVY